MYRFLKLCANTNRRGRRINQTIPAAHDGWPLLRNPGRHLATSTSTATTTTTRSTTAAAAPKTNFDAMIQQRRNEAARSLLVQVNSDKSYAELYRYCSQFGAIRNAHHYVAHDSHYILLEFGERDAAQAAIRSSTFNEESGSLVVQSPFLWFRAGPKTATGMHQAATTTTTTAIPALSTVNGNRQLVDRELNDTMRRLPSMTAQMHLLHQSAQLTDVGTRLRFLAARQIEQAMHGIFPNAVAFPFGSSVNGFGRVGCDLDLILRLSAEERVVRSALYSIGITVLEKESTINIFLARAIPTRGSCSTPKRTSATADRRRNAKWRASATCCNCSCLACAMCAASCRLECPSSSTTTIIWT